MDRIAKHLRAPAATSRVAYLAGQHEPDLWESMKPGKREAFLAEFRKLIPPVRAEAGCLEYVPAIDIPQHS